MADLEDKQLENISREELQGIVHQLHTRRGNGRTSGEAPSTQPRIAPVAGDVYSGPTPSGDAEIRAAYCELMVRRCSRLTYSGLEPVNLASDYPVPRLERVYINLDTQTRVSAQGLQQALEAGHTQTLDNLATADAADLRPLSVLEAVVLQRRSVLLGVAGAGKTTLVKRLCLALAGQQWDSLESWPEPERNRLPILVSLRDFACWLRNQPTLPAAGAALLWTYICHDLNNRNLGFAEDLLAEAVDKGHAQLCLDGLDELPALLQQTVGDTLVDFAKSNHRAWLLVTCRTPAYQRVRLPKKRFPVLNLAPFDRDKSRHFVTRWYAEWAEIGHESPERALSLAAQLEESLEKPELVALGATPLLLTLTALVHSHDKALPAQRVIFYERAVYHLLGRWRGNEHHGDATLPLWLEAGGCSERELLRVLARLAYQMTQADDPEHTGGFDEHTLEQALADLHPKGSTAWARVLLIQLSQGLLVEHAPGVFSFLHPNLQDYLAASYLAQAEDFVDQCSKLAEQPARWRPVLRLAAAYKLYCQQDFQPVLAWLNQLCERGAHEEGLGMLRLAGGVLLELGLQPISEQAGGADLLEQARDRLTAVLEHGRRAPLERAWFGDLVGRLGDPRFESQHGYLPCRYRGQGEPGLGFIKIAAGSFTLGSQRSDVEATDNEYGNADSLEIPYAYWMARYPVTVAQYSVFVNNGGYVDTNWWQTETARSWLRAEAIPAPRGWEGQRLYPNRPVTGVSWFEARAYCAWLEARLRAPTQSPLPPNYAIRLPTEAEWEKAARSGGRSRYPWGDADWHPQRANTSTSGIGHPTAVGIYPAGTTPTGLHDLAGNVWEWTLSKDNEYPYDPIRHDLEEMASRVVRGGSWNDPPKAARCASRTSFYADHRSHFVGFRVVVSVANATECPSV